MDPFQHNAQDTRTQPWKQWVQQELDARKKADETEDGRKAQEDRVKAYIQKTDGGNEGEGSNNKAG